MPELQFTTKIAVSRELLLSWHNRSGAFERLLPPWQKAKALKCPESVMEGEEIILIIKKFGLKHSILSKITKVEKNGNFTDEMQSSPFRLWSHNHLFKMEGKNRSVLIDHIHYELPLGTIGKLFFGQAIEKEIKKVFKYRHATIKQDLERDLVKLTAKKLRILIAGGTGLIGTALKPFLEAMGHQVYILSRKPTGKRDIYWDPDRGEIDRKNLKRIDAVINLAGANIAGARWTKRTKKRIVDSRIKSTKFLCQIILQLEQRPEVLINASGSGYYPLDQKTHSETDLPGNHFLANLCKNWEQSVERVRESGIRTVAIRLGAVITSKGGALKMMLPAFKLGLGGKIGSGQQHISYIGLDDTIEIIYRIITDQSIMGPINLTVTHSIKQEDFARSIGEKLSRPTILPLPAMVIKAIFGEMGKVMLLGNNSIEPKRLLEANYKFRNNNLKEILDHTL